MIDLGSRSLHRFDTTNECDQTSDRSWGNFSFDETANVIFGNFGAERVVTFYATGKSLPYSVVVNDYYGLNKLVEDFWVELSTGLVVNFEKGLTIEMDEGDGLRFSGRWTEYLLVYGISYAPKYYSSGVYYVKTFDNTTTGSFVYGTWKPEWVLWDTDMFYLQIAWGSPDIPPF